MNGDFEVKKSSPHHPASNGQSERSVGTIKQLMRKAAEEGRDIHLAMVEYRNTPISGLEYSPAQLLMSRMLKDKLPTPTTLLFPKLAQEAHRSLSARQERQKKYHDRGTKILPPLQVGDPVRIQQGRIWSPAIIMEKHEAPVRLESEPKTVKFTVETASSYANHLSQDQFSRSNQCPQHHPQPPSQSRQQPWHPLASLQKLLRHQ